MANNVQPPKTQQLIKSDRRSFSASDDSAMMKQIQATHSPDGREVDAKPILRIVEDILRRATHSINGVVAGTHALQTETLEEKNNLAAVDGMLDALAYIIQKISCEISCKCSGGGDAHSTAVVLFNSLSNYSWDAKVVLTLAAFAANYGEFWLVAQLYTTNSLAKSIALLKQLPEILEHSNSLKSRFDALNNLIKAMLDVTKCIIEFQELPSQYISQDTPEMSIAMAHIPAAAYWTIRSVVACASQITSLTGMSHEYITSTTEAWELSSLAHKVNNIHGHLKKQLTLCNQHIDEKRHIEAFQTLVRLFETLHMDNMKILKALIYSKDDLQPLLNGSNKTRVNIEVLRRKHVLLLISDLEITHEEVMILDQSYRESRTKPEIEYEVVWLPIVDRMTTLLSGENQHKFEQLLPLMSWYIVHPSMLEPAVIRYIKEVWHFTKKLIIVPLDPQGRVACPNALHMMWIWGNLAFPFTSMKEEALWKAETWRLELLVDSFDAAILDWIVKGKLICLYGGEDIEWIRKFTKTMKDVAKAAGISLEMVYAGKSSPKDRIRKNIAIINGEGLSHCWPDPSFIWFFWARLESMLYSKMQHGKTVENDRIMQEVMTILSFDGSDLGWAVISKGSAEMAKAKGDTVLTCLGQFENWEENAKQNGFVQALNDYLQQLHTPHHCNRLILPGINGAILERVICAECGRPMEKYFMYRCCTD